MPPIELFSHPIVNALFADSSADGDEGVVEFLVLLDCIYESIIDLNGPNAEIWCGGVNNGHCEDGESSGSGSGTRAGTDAVPREDISTSNEGGWAGTRGVCISAAEKASANDAERERWEFPLSPKERSSAAVNTRSARR